MMTKADEKNKLSESEVQLEYEEELNDLEYSGNNETPSFDMIRVNQERFSIYELYRKYKKQQLVLDVEFQRKYVWDTKQKSELIESILMGLPLPIFYFKQQNNSTYVVVDGKQRLSALFDFLDNKFVLKSLKILDFLNGKSFKNLENDFGIYQSQLEDYQVYSHVILPPTPDRIIFDIFDRVNRGGTKLNKQEIRNALYHGIGLDMIVNVTKSKAFENATRIEYAKDSRMKGAYLITRFLSFYLLLNGLLYRDGKKYEYTGDSDDLIEAMLIQLNSMDLKTLENLEKLVLKCLEKASDIFGRGAFRRGLQESKPINMNIFETTMYLMSLIPDKIVSSKSRVELYNKMKKITMSEEFEYYIGNSRDNTVKVEGRFKLMKQLFEEVCND